MLIVFTKTKLENEGFPDSTYDAWKTKGVSAYCGGLWISALRISLEICKILENDLKSNQDFSEWKKKIEKLFPTALKYYEIQLWKGEDQNNGGFYYYDNSKSKNSNSLMADAFQGHFNLLICGIEPVLNREKVNSMLSKIYRFNFQEFNQKLSKKGCGMVNGMKTEECVPKIDQASNQSKEVWIGVCYTIAALFLLEGEKEKAYEILKSIYENVWNRGYHFQTPEAVMGGLPFLPFFI